MITFKQAVEHLRGRIERGEPLAIRFNSNACVYDKAANGGCAIGAHIPDEHYHQDMEGLVVEEVFDRFSKVEMLFEAGAPWGDLQGWHDCVAGDFPDRASTYKSKCERFLAEQEALNSAPTL